MITVDYSILISASQEFIWEYISDLSHNSDWQTDCDNVAFISPRHKGVGVRWRYNLPNGRTYIAETTTWYDKLGYEYTLVDGAPFRESKGRIRLQEIAEGTVVQWSFAYDMGGFLGAARNVLGTQRQIERAMIESLGSLRSIIHTSSQPKKPRAAKSLMQEGLDYEARSRYKPRHPTNKTETPATPMSPVIIEPPISEEDTRPRVPAKLDTSVNEPAFLSDMPASQSVQEAEAQIVPEFARPISPPEPLLALRPVPSAENLASTEEDQAVPQPKQDDSREVMEVSVSHSSLEETQEDLSFASTTAARDVLPTTSEMVEVDTAVVSVFEVFGIQRPSQKQELLTIDEDSEQTSTLLLDSEPPKGLRRVGLRRVLRSKQVKVRRPI